MTAPFTAATAAPAAEPVAVLGAGLMGRLIAWRLLREGYPVSLFEAGSFHHPRCAAHTAAAMISPLSEVVTADPAIYRMGLQSLALWPEWLAELNRTLDHPIQYQANGSIVVAHPQDAAELAQFKQDLAAKLGAEDQSQWLDQTRIAQREPSLQHFQQGLFLPHEAHLDNRHLLAVLLQQIQQLGGHCQDETPLADNSPQLQNYHWVFDCRGMGAKPQQPTLRGVRGEVMWVETGEVTLNHAVRLCHPRYKLYVVPKPRQRFIIGATEIESEDTSDISLQSTLELASALYTIHPAFAEARVIETDVNLRPAYVDNLPRVERRGQLIRINGLYRHGYLLAPVMVERALAQLQSPQMQQ